MFAASRTRLNATTSFLAPNKLMRAPSHAPLITVVAPRLPRSSLRVTLSSPVFAQTALIGPLEVSALVIVDVMEALTTTLACAATLKASAAPAMADSIEIPPDQARPPGEFAPCGDLASEFWRPPNRTSVGQSRFLFCARRNTSKPHANNWRVHGAARFGIVF